MVALTRPASSEKYYAGIKDDTRLHVKLTGSWETLVGEQDVFGDYPYLPLIQLLIFSLVHILEYENYAGYDKTVNLIRNSEVISMVYPYPHLLTPPVARRVLQGAASICELTIYTACTGICLLTHRSAPCSRRHL